MNVYAINSFTPSTLHTTSKNTFSTICGCALIFAARNIQAYVPGSKSRQQTVKRKNWWGFSPQ